MTRKDKAIAIIRRIRDLANDHVQVTFGDDWGGNSLTVYLKGPDGNTHHHIPTVPHSSEEQMIDELHALLTSPSICAEVIKLDKAEN